LDKYKKHDGGSMMILEIFENGNSSQFQNKKINPL
jgi:hypothetical protein